MHLICWRRNNNDQNLPDFEIPTRPLLPRQVQDQNVMETM